MSRGRVTPWRRRVASLSGAAALIGVLLAAPPASAASGRTAPIWTVGTHFAPAIQEGVNVACPTRLFCYASEVTTSGLFALRATTDGGQTWHTQWTAAPGVVLNAVACASRTRCVALDGESSLRAFWTDDGGQSWRSTRLPASTFLVSTVTCLKSGVCAAAGLDVQNNPVLLETTDEGTTWRAHVINPAIASDPFTNASLTLACVTWRDCVVGQRGSTGSVFSTGDAGRHWRTIALPRRFGEITGIGCTRMGHCALAGWSGSEGTVATSGNGGRSWRLTLATRSVMGFYDAACTERGACVAVGATRDRFLVAARTTDGRHWRAAAVKAPQLVIIPFVGCGAATCTIVSGAATGLSVIATTRDLGRSWVTEDPQQIPDQPVSVSCPVPGTCELVGYAQGGALAERTTDDGATFTTQQVPAGVTQLRDVSCGAALDCQAIGVAVAPLVHFVVLGTTNGGATWTVEGLPPSVAVLTALQCASATMCVAVGVDKSFGMTVLATTDGGQTWTAGTLHGVKEQLAEPTSVTCQSATNCVAGLFGIPTPGFLVTTDGGANWTFQPSAPAGSSGGILGPIPITEACSSATTCVAVAESLFGGGLSVLVSHDGGTTWTAENVFGADLDQVSPLQCLPDGRCELVAADELTSRSYLLTSLDGGTSWSSSSMPAGWLISVALSCSSDSSCFSVGIESDGGFAFAHYG